MIFLHSSMKQKMVGGLVLLALLLQPISLVFAQGVETVPASTPAVDVSAAPSANPTIPETNTPASTDTSATTETETKQNAIQDVTSKLSPEVTPTATTPVSTSVEGKVPVDGGENNAQTLTGDPTTYDNSNFTYRKTVTPEANNASGALSYSYDIVTPPGRAGMEPGLKLTYNSADTSNINLLGYGWNTNISYIERLNLRGVNNMYANNDFTSSLSGELAYASSTGVYQARIENGSFLKYTYNASTSTWKAYDKEGKVYTFGSVSDSRSADSENAAHIGQWYLDGIVDAHGNSISYTYIVFAGKVFPSEIKYTNFTSSGGTFTPGIYKVSFIYNDVTRPDNMIFSYKFGYQIVNNTRLKSIEVSASDVLIRKYVLYYGAGVNGVRSMLTSLTETGYDAQGTPTELPPTTFAYTQGFENQALSAGLPASLSTGTFLNSLFYGPPRNGKTFTDLNGDGYLDSFLFYYWYDNFHTDITWNQFGIPEQANNNPQWWPRFVFANIAPNNINGSNPADQGARIGDLNGDGFNDFVGQAYNATTSITYIFGGPKDPNTGLYNFTATTTGAENVEPRDFLADFNGQGIPHLYKRDVNQDLYAGMDINADGIDDYKNENGATFIFSNGAKTSNYMQVLLAETDQYGNDMGVRYMDFNADGLIDVLQGRSVPYTLGPAPFDIHDVYVNTGSSFVKNTNLTAPYFLTATTTQHANFFDYTLTDYYDTNGDGIVDAPGAPTTKADLLKTITYPQGGSTAIEYKTTAGGTLLNPKLPTVMWIVSKITTTDGLGGTPQVSTYSYADGQGYFNAAYDRKFAGFGKVTRTTGTTVTVSYFHQGNGNDAAAGETGDSYGKIGSPYKVEVFDTNGNLFSRTQNIYGESALAGVSWSAGFASSSPVFVYLSKKIEESYDGTANHRDRATEYTYDTANGNLLSTIEYGEVTSGSTAGQASATFSDTGNDKATKGFEFADNSAATSTPQFHYEIARTTIVPQGSGTPMAETKTYFDGLSYGQLSLGDETKRAVLMSTVSGLYASTTASYNSYGLVATSTDANGNKTGYVYDSYNLYPLSSTNALNQKTQYEYNYALGKPQKITDANNQIRSVVFDPFGRTLEEKEPDPNSNVATGTPAALITKATYVYTDTPLATSVKKTTTIDSGLTTESYTFVDGLGRTIQSRKQSENSTVFAVTDTVYDADGNVAKTSLPYWSNGSSKTAATSDATLFTNLTYDPLNRTVQKTDAVGTTTTAYVTWKSTVTDPLGKAKSYYKDAFDRLVRVDENNASSTYTTLYDYDALGNLTKITDALSNVRNFTYDARSKRLTAEDLHTVGDGTYGVYTYQYDPVGNTTKAIDPNGTETTSTYDALNRLTKTDVLVSTIGLPLGTKATYTYDTCDFGIGTLCSVTYVDDSDAASVETNSTSLLYNPAGKAKRETKVLHGLTFTSNFVYGQGGVLTQSFGPDGNKTAYTYNTGGLIDLVTYTEIATSSATTTTIAGFDYAPTGQVATTTAGNGTVTVATYDPAHLYRLTSKRTTGPSGQKIQFSTYAYDAVGNILSITDTSDTATSKLTTYAYDDLYRLTTASTSPTTATSTMGQASYRQVFTYNALGNILTKVESGATGSTATTTYAYAGTAYTNPHAPTSIATTGTATTTLAYDKNGNITSSGSITYIFDFANRLNKVVMGSASSTYAYDQSGTRIKVKDATGTTFYPNKAFNTTYTPTGIKTTETSHIFAGDTTLATFEKRTPVLTNTGTCSIPASGDFTLTTSCTVIGTVYVPGSIIIPNTKILTANATSTLLVNLKAKKIQVQKGGGLLIKKGATVRQLKSSDLPGTSFTFHNTDHLGSVMISTDANGAITEVLDYAPYGAKRVDVGQFTTDRQYIGERYDAATGLSYLNARYYDGNRGQFLSEDPVFWEIAQTDDGKKVLQNPQAQNSYAYTNGNPVVYRDPEGRIVDTALDLAFIAYDVFRIIKAANEGHENIKQEFAALGLDGIGALIPGVTGLGVASRLQKVEHIVEAERAVAETSRATINMLEVGKYGDEAIAARSTARDFTKTERDKLNIIGKNTGCHTCGVKTPGTKSGNFVPDHQPVSAIVPQGTSQKLYPQCVNCSRVQGGQVRSKQTKSK